jgi:hypothetical protein
MADELPTQPPGMPPPRVEPTPDAIAPGTPPALPVPASAIQVGPASQPAIVLDPSKQAKDTSIATPKGPNKDGDTKDTIRELMETIVFVVVLVLMLKTFLAEAFVIPTGSMADTLLGYHYKVTCDQCGYRNLVNASSEAEPQRGDQVLLISKCQCQNCGETKIIRNVPQLRQGGQP